MTDFSDHPGIFEDETLIVDEANRIIARQKARELVSARDAETWEPPELLTLDQRLQLPRPEVTYRIQGWQPTNTRAIFDGAAKAGKTTVIGNLIRSLVDGDPWLGVAEVTPVEKLALLDFEMGGAMLDDWLNDQGIRNEDRVTVASLRGRASSFNITDPAIRKRWAELLTGHDYLILDPLKPILDALGLDERSEVGKFLTPFDELLVEAGIPDAFIAHHQGHYAERSRGDSTLLGWPDVLWTIVRENEDPASPRYIKAFGRDVDEPESLLNYDQATRHLTLTSGTRSAAKARALVSQLVDVVNQADHPVMLNELNDRLEGRKSDVSRASHRAEYQGLVAVEIGPRRARIHRPILATGSGTSQTPLVPNGGNQSETEKPPIEQGENEDSSPLVPTGSNQFRNQSGALVPDIYMSEPVNRSETTPSACPECGLSTGRHGYACRHREPTPEEIAT